MATMEARMDLDGDEVITPIEKRHHSLEVDESDAENAVEELEASVRKDISNASREELKQLEKDIVQLCELYFQLSNASAMRKLIDDIRPFLGTVSKAKGGKVFKHLIDRYVELESASNDEKVSMCQDCITWAVENKRTFLRQALEVRLVSLHLDTNDFQASLIQAAPLIKELKRLDDRQLLVEVHLMESRALFALSNFPRARASLVAARTSANTIYCPPKMQAALDLQSGILHAQEKDFKTAYSYFYEAFEGYDSINSPKNAVKGLKYMLLTKVLLNEASDVSVIVTGKLALKYSGRGLEAMQAIAAANLKRSLADFEKALADYNEELDGDVIVQGHVAFLYDSLLAQNLQRIIEPFSCVEVQHVAEKINLPINVVEKKLSQMILDSVLNGILDQGTGCLEIFEPEVEDPTFTTVLEAICHTSNVLTTLEKKAQKLLV